MGSSWTQIVLRLRDWPPSPRACSWCQPVMNQSQQNRTVLDKS